MTYSRSFSLITVVLAMLFLPFWVSVCFMLLYAYVYSAYELLLIAVLIDAQFGSAENGLWYLYTLSASFILILTVYTKPHLRFYQ